MTNIKPADDKLIASIVTALAEVRQHAHPAGGAVPDLYCLNLTSWMGERMGAVLARVDEQAAEIQRLRASGGNWVNCTPAWLASRPAGACGDTPRRGVYEECTEHPRHFVQAGHEHLERDAEIQRLRAVAPLTAVFHLWHEDNAWWSANAVYTDCDGAMAAGERKFVEDEGPANTDALRWEPRGQTRWALMDGNEATGVLVDRREIQAAAR